MSTALRLAGLSMLVLASACGEAVVGSSRFANTPPTVDPLADVTTLEDTPTSTAVTFTDAEDVEVISITAESDNAALIDASGIVVSGTGGARTIALTPKPNANGSATITVTITDGGGHVDPIVLTFTFNVTPVNDPPVILGLADVTIDEDGSTGPNAFTITDVDDDLATIVVTATSSDLAVAPTVTIAAGATPGSYTWSVTPPANANGVTTLTFSADDGTDTTTGTVTLTVNAVNDQPTFTQTITAQTFNEDQTIPGLALAVDDVETALPALAVTATSDNPALLDASRISVTSGAAGARTLTLDPFDNMFGTATITVTVDDGSGAANATNTFTFLLTINSVNDLPTISTIAAQTFDEDDPAGTGALAFTVADIEDDLAMATMVVTASSNQPGVIPNDAAHLTLTTITRNGREITVLALPDANTFPPPAFTNQPVTITLTVTDSNLATAQTTFTVTINAQNDPPRLDPIASIVTAEDTPTSFSVTFRDPDSNLDNVVMSFTTSDGVVLPGGIAETGRVTDTTDPLNPFQTRTYSLSPEFNAFHSGGTFTTVSVSGSSEGAASPTPTTFTVTVTPVNDQPQINFAATITTTEGTPTPATAFTLSDVDNTLSLANLTVTANSNTTMIPTANIVFGGTPASPTITLTPVGDLNGPSTITVRIDDGSGAVNATNTDTFTFNVTPVNDAPDLMDVADQMVNEDGTLSLTVTFTDVDGCTGLALTGSSDNAALVTSVVASPLASTVCSFSLTVTPIANRNSDLDGTATISLSLTDNGNGGAGALGDSDTFVLTVVADPDYPIVTDESFTSEGNRTVVVATSLLVNDTNPDVGPLTITGSSNETGGTVVIAGDGSFTFFPTAGFLGAAGFDYTVSNGSALTTDGHVTITFGTRMHWYVDNSLTGPGDGTEADPFVDLSDVTTSIQWAAGEDWIHLDYGTGAAYTGATLDDDCDLLGIPGGGSGTTPPTITDATCVEMNGTSIVSDVLLENCSSIAIDAIGVATSLSIVDVTIDGGATGLAVNGFGTGVGPTVSIDGLMITGTTVASVTMQDVTFSASGTNAIGAADGSGFVATNVSFGGGVTISDLTVGSTATPSTSGFGISLDACIGELTVTEVDLHFSTAGNGILLDDARLEITNAASVIATTGSGYSIRVLESGGTSSLEGQVGTISCNSSASRCVSIDDADLNFSVTTDFDAATTGNFRPLSVANTGGTRFRIVDGDDGRISTTATTHAVYLENVTGLDVTVRRVDHASSNSSGIRLIGTSGKFHVDGDGTGGRNGSGGAIDTNNSGEIALSVTGLSDVVIRSMDLSNSATNGGAVEIDGASVVDLDGCQIDGGANGTGINATTFQGELTLTGTRITSTERMLVVTTPGNGDSVVTIDDTTAATSAFDTGEPDSRCIVLTSTGTHAATLDVSSTSFSACGVYAIEAQATGTGNHLVRVASSSFPTSATTTSAIRMISANAAGHELQVSGTTFGTVIGDMIDYDATTCTGRSVVNLTSNSFGVLDAFESGSTTGNAVAVNLIGGNGCAVVHTFTSNNIYGVQDASRAGLNLDYALVGTADSNLEIHSNIVDLTAGAATTNASALRLNSGGTKGVCMDIDGNRFDSANPGWDVNATSGTTTAASIVESSQTGWTTILTPLNADNTLSNLRVTETTGGFVEGTCNGAL